MIRARCKVVVAFALSVTAVVSAQAATANVVILPETSVARLVRGEVGSLTDFAAFSLASQAPQYQPGAAAGGRLVGASQVRAATTLSFSNLQGTHDFLAQPKNVKVCDQCGLNWIERHEGGFSYYATITGAMSGAPVVDQTTPAKPVELPPGVWLLAAGLAGLIIVGRRGTPPPGRGFAEKKGQEHNTDREHCKESIAKLNWIAGTPPAQAAKFFWNPS